MTQQMTVGDRFAERQVVHLLRLQGDVSELYDVGALAGVVRPMALEFKSDEIQHLLAVDDEGTL